MILVLFKFQSERGEIFLLLKLKVFIKPSIPSIVLIWSQPAQELVLVTQSPHVKSISIKMYGVASVTTESRYYSVLCNFQHVKCILRLFEVIRLIILMSVQEFLQLDIQIVSSASVAPPHFLITSFVAFRRFNDLNHYLFAL